MLKPDPEMTAPAQLCISGLEFKCRECGEKRTIPVAEFLVADKWIGSVMHMCQHWDAVSAMQKGKRPWDEIGQFCGVLADMVGRLKDHDLRILLDITVEG